MCSIISFSYTVGKFTITSMIKAYWSCALNEHKYPTNNGYLLHKYSELNTKRLNIKTDTTDLTTYWMCVVVYYVILFGCGWGLYCKIVSNHNSCAIQTSGFTVYNVTDIICKRRVSTVFEYNKLAQLSTKWVYQIVNVMFWLLWCESEDHMLMIMNETHKHWAWTQSTNHTNKTQTNHKHTIHSIYQCMCHHSLNTNTHHL